MGCRILVGRTRSGSRGSSFQYINVVRRICIFAIMHSCTPCFLILRACRPADHSFNHCPLMGELVPRAMATVMAPNGFASGFGGNQTHPRGTWGYLESSADAGMGEGRGESVVCRFILRRMNRQCKRAQLACISSSRGNHALYFDVVCGVAGDSVSHSLNRCLTGVCS